MYGPLLARLYGKLHNTHIDTHTHQRLEKIQLESKLDSAFVSFP